MSKKSKKFYLFVSVSPIQSPGFDVSIKTIPNLNLDPDRWSVISYRNNYNYILESDLFLRELY